METEGFRTFCFQRPAQVQIDITDRCNLDCKYCYNKSNSFSAHTELSDSDFEKVVEKVLSQLRPYFISFSGGEPLMRKDLLFKMIEKIKREKIYVHLNTNGTLIDENIAIELARLNIDKININIESLDGTNHDYLRGEVGSFARLMENIDILKKHISPQKISIATVVNKKNIDALIDLAEFVEKNKFMEFHLLDMIPTHTCERDLVPTKEDWNKFYTIFKKIKKIPIRIKPNHALLFLNGFSNKSLLPFCMAGRLKIVICADGSIVPCNYFKEPAYLCGNAKDDDLLKIWKDSEIIKEFRGTSVGYAECKNCSQFQYCAGGCKALSKALRKDPFKADPYCKIYMLKNVQTE